MRLRKTAANAGAVAIALLLAACGQRLALEPVPPHVLPPAPYGASERLTSEELLAIDPQAAPERNVELRRVSEEREDDPFDLPPEG
jgi:hypothetical protein